MNELSQRVNPPSYSITVFTVDWLHLKQGIWKSSIIVVESFCWCVSKCSTSFWSFNIPLEDVCQQTCRSNHRLSEFWLLTKQPIYPTNTKHSRNEESRHISCEFLQKAWYYWLGWRDTNCIICILYTVYVNKKTCIYIYILSSHAAKPTPLPPPYAIVVIYLTLSPIHLCKNFTCCSPSYVEALSTTTLWLLIGVVEDKPQQSRFWTQSFVIKQNHVRFSESKKACGKAFGGL